MSGFKLTQGSIGRKLVMGLTGLFLVVFVVLHLIGNLLLLFGPDEFNKYAHFLTTAGHGSVKYIGEFFLVILFGTHIIKGLTVRTIGQGREHSYAVSASKGGPSRNGLPARWMAISGMIIMVFLIGHVLAFRQPMGVSPLHAPALVSVDGVEMHNLFGVVLEGFSSAGTVGFYTFVMILLGLHLYHGIWSAFQSLGMMNHRYEGLIDMAKVMLVSALVVGFVSLPTIMYVKHDEYQALNTKYMNTYSVNSQSTSH